MKTTSRFALAAAAGLFVGGIALTPANAADLGGDCCADLEERVAELEATTARKGNRKVSLEIYGQVNRALLVWDDGDDSDAYIVDNDYTSTRFGFKGKATMKPGWTAGFNIEIEVQDAASNDVSQVNDEGNSENDTLLIRQSNVYVESERLGRVTIGHQSLASDGIAEINLANTVSLDASEDFVQSFAVGGTTWGVIADELDGLSRNDAVRYDSPSIYGFILSTSWGDNDVFDVALRFKKEWNSIRFAAGVAYFWDGSRKTVVEDDPADDDFGDLVSVGDGRDSEGVSGSASALHIPTGLYVTVAAGTRSFDDAPDAQGDVDEEYFYIQAGINKKFFSYGPTTIYVDYGDYNDFGVPTSNLTSSEVERYGFGVVQTFDSAALDLYALFQHWEADLEGGDAAGGAGDPDEISVGVVGARIKF